MKATPYPKNNVEVADDFYTDCDDLLFRYDATFEHLFAIKSKRFKLFNDLRSGYECGLKGIIAYGQPRDMERRTLICIAEKHRHNIAKLEAEASHYTDSMPVDLQEYGVVLDQLPIGLRYSLDGYDFLEANETLYYETIGDDGWLTRLRTYIGALRDCFGKELARHSGILTVADLPIEKLFGNKYNKYRK